MDENRTEAVPTLFANLERLVDELNQLGQSIPRTSSQQRDEGHKDDVEATLVIRDQ